jgi:type I restriction enzyme S subunit
MQPELQFCPISELAIINPPVSAAGLRPDAPVSFIPMSDVSETGQWTGRQRRRLREVRGGYTPFSEGDILFAKITPCMENGKGAHACNLVNGIGFGTTEFHVLRARPQNDARFIYHCLQSEPLRRKAEAMMTGSAGQQRVAAEFFERYRVPLFPLPEQRRIAEVLDTVDAVIQQTEALISKLKQMKAGLLHDLLARGLDEHGQFRDPVAHPDQFKESTLGRVPKSWEISSVSCEFDIAAGFTLGEHRRPRRNKRRYLRVANVQREQLILDDIAELEAEDAEMVGRVLEENDLLVVEGHANRHEIGRCARVTAEAAGLTFQNHLFRLRCKRLNPKYALAWLNSEWVRAYWQRLCVTSSGLNTINRAMLSVLIVLAPGPWEQAQIVRRLDAHDARIQAEEAYRDKLKLVKKGLMHDLLTGRVRVKLDEEAVA